MKKITEVLKEARILKNFSVAYLERKTKIKSSFIDAIENEDWNNLPPFPIVLGFVKSLASALSIDENMAVALLKRDYPPKNIRISPRPDIVNKFVWSPKLTFAVGVCTILLVLVGYLTVQYIHFISPPSLSLDSPKEGQVVTSGSIDVFGTTDSDAKIIINNQPVEVSEDGKFNVTLEVVPETKKISIQASSRSGKITTVSRNVEVRQ